MDQPKIERLLRLIKLLTSNVNYTVDEIACKLEMSRRTVYRYIDTLKSAGFVVRRVDDSFHMLKENHRLDDIDKLVHFSEEEGALVNRLIDGLDDTNMLKLNLRKKLAAVYNFTSLADCVVKKESVANTHELISAIEGRRQVVLRRYSSSNKGDVRDRVVEPFEFTTNYIQVWCYEPQTGMNKLFRVSRIGSVEVTDAAWQFESEHCSAKMDIFRTGGTEGRRVKLELGVMAKNLLIEEFPLAVRDLSLLPDGERWLLDTVVYRYEGVGRFVIGVANDVVIREGDGLRDYLRNFVDSHCRKLFDAE